MSIEKFGEGFEQDNTDRVEIHTPREVLPRYSDLALEIRDALKQSVAEQGWPDVPTDFAGVEDFFGRASRTTALIWQKTAGELIKGALEKIKDGLTKVEGGNQLDTFYLEPDRFEAQLAIQQINMLEPMRELDSEAWRTLLAISSERQLSRIALVHHWYTQMQESDFEKLGINKDELKILLSLGAIEGKHFDQAYMKQVEYADQPGGKAGTEFGEKEGAEYLYDLPSADGKEIDPKTYAEMFPKEWERITNRFQSIGEEVERLLFAGRLGEEYRDLPKYLFLLANASGSNEKDPEAMKKLWEEVDRQQKLLTESGCPIIPVCMGAASVTGDAGKIDVELRVELRKSTSSSDIKEKQEVLDLYRQTAAELNGEYASLLEEETPIPPVYYTFQPFAFGPNLHWNTAAETSEKQIICHSNIIIENAVITEIPMLRRIFPEETFSDLDYKEAIILETVLHELAHAVVPQSDERVKSRLGERKNADVLEEIKADIVGMLVLKRSDEKHPLEESELRMQLIAKLGAIIEYLTSSSMTGEMGQAYYYAGLLEIKELVDKGVIEPSGSGYRIVDYRKGIDILAAKGVEILERLYLDDASDKARVEEFLKDIPSIIDEPSVQKLTSFAESVR